MKVYIVHCVFFLIAHFTRSAGGTNDGQGMPSSLAVAYNNNIDYDSRSALPKCSAWLPINQKGCQACCAAALASAVGARACVNDHRDVQFSVQHIWDCAFNGIISCEAGVNPLQFFAALFNKDAFTHVFSLASPPESARPITPSNQSACTSSSNETVTSFKMAQNAEIPLAEATQALEQEIWQYGPVVAIIHFQQQADFNRFQNLSNFDILHPINAYSTAASATTEQYKAHCVSVIGWGKDHWLIQNSFGASWGSNGFARLARNEWGIEQSWFALNLRHIPCQGKCIIDNNNMLLPQHASEQPDQIPNASIALITISGIFVIALVLFVFYKPSPVIPYHAPETY